jgi:hypothetical protein
LIINRKQLYLATIIKCVDDFRGLENFSDLKTISKYLELTNVELFYFKQGYLPKDVAIEWLDGMIEYIPIRNQKNEVLNHKSNTVFKVEGFETLLQKYPRIQNAFRVSGKYDFSVIYNVDESVDKRMKERRRLIEEIIANNKRFKYFD